MCVYVYWGVVMGSYSFHNCSCPKACHDAILFLSLSLLSLSPLSLSLSSLSSLVSLSSSSFLSLSLSLLSLLLSSLFSLSLSLFLSLALISLSIYSLLPHRYQPFLFYYWNYSWAFYKSCYNHKLCWFIEGMLYSFFWRILFSPNFHAFAFI